MPGGGRLTLETANVELDRAHVASHPSIALEPSDYAMLTVSDTGSGIDTETQARIFDSFFTTKGPTEGTGLDLSTVYGIAWQSGGAIWVYSEPGHGATSKSTCPASRPWTATARRTASRTRSRGRSDRSCAS